MPTLFALQAGCDILGEVLQLEQDVAVIVSEVKT